MLHDPSVEMAQVWRPRAAKVLGPVGRGTADDEVQQGGQPVISDSPEVGGQAEVERRHDQFQRRIFPAAAHRR